MTIDLVTPEVVEALAKRVARLEDVVIHRSYVKTPPLFADNELLKHTFRTILAQLGVSGLPMSAEELHKRFAELDLEPNEFSRGIIAMREE